MGTLIRCFFEAESNMTLQMSAEKIWSLHKQIARFFRKKDWLLQRTEIGDLTEDQILNLILAYWFKLIAKQTRVKNLSKSFVDNIPKTLTFYSSKQFDDDTVIRYSVGGKSEITKYSHIIIENYNCLENLRTLEGIIQFITFLSEVTNAEEITVSDYDVKRILNFESDEVWFGWIAYFRKDVPLPKIPEGFKIINISKGKLVITCEEIFNYQDPETFKRIQKLVDTFRAEKYTRMLRK